MKEAEVIALMGSSTSKTEWNANCDKVKKAFGGNYPPFWYQAVIVSGLADKTAKKWGGTAEIKIHTYVRK